MGLPGQLGGSSVLCIGSCIGSCIQGECLQQECPGWLLVCQGLPPYGISHSGVRPELLQRRTAELQDRHGSIKTLLAKSQNVSSGLYCW